MRSTALKGFNLLPLFIRSESWTREGVAAETQMSANAAYDFLKTMVAAGILEEFDGEGREHRFRLSDSFKDLLRGMLGQARRHDVEALITARTQEAERGLRVQMEHLVNELREVVK